VEIEEPEQPISPTPTPTDDCDSRDAAVDPSGILGYLLSLPDLPDTDPEPDPTVGELLEQALAPGGADRIAAEARRRDPGPLTAQMLTTIDPRQLGPAGLLNAVCAAERLASWTQATQHRYLAAFADPGVAAPMAALSDYANAPGQPLNRLSRKESAAADSDRDHTSSGSATDGQSEQHKAALAGVAIKVAAAEVSAALLISPINANRRVAQAVDFNEQLPATLAALRDGVIDRGRALVIADRTQNLPSDLRRRVESVVVRKAATRTAGQLRGIADRAVIAADPAAAKKRHQAAQARRGISIRAGEDGMSVFRADLTPDKACTAFNVLDQLAIINGRNSAEKRSIGALRADAFTDIFDQLADHGSVHLKTVLGRPHDKGSPCPHHSSRSHPGAAPVPHPSAADETATATAAPTEPATATEPAEASAKQDVWPSAECDSDDDRGPTATVDTCCTVVRQADIVEAAGGMARSTGAAESHSGTGPRGSRNAGTSSSAETDTGDPTSIETDVQLQDSAGADHAAGDSDTTHSAAVSAARRREKAPAGDRPPSPRPAVLDGPDPGATTSERAGQTLGGVPRDRRVTCDCPDEDGDARGTQWGLGTHHGRTIGLNVTIAATTLAGLDDLPAELEGHGAILAGLGRALAASAATITAIGVDPECGTALDLGRTVYRPRLAQRDRVVQRDGTCRFVGCRQPAWRCQIDHSDKFCPGRDDGGITCPCNLACLCKFHHDLKTFGIWDTRHHQDGSITWISGTGRSYVSQTREWATGLALGAVPIDDPQRTTNKLIDGSGSATDPGDPSTGPGGHHDDDPPF
jgi:hypothetical protein